MMRKGCILIFLLAAFIPVSSISAEEPTTKAFVVNLTDGTTVRYIITDNPKVTFDEGDVYVRSDIAEAVYAHSEIQKFYFEDYIVSNMNSVEAQKEIIFRYVDRNLVEVMGDIRGVPVRLYGMDGCLLQNFIAQDTSVQIDLTGLSAGIYIININSRTIKIYKR